MKFTLTVDMDNAAFEDDAELARILRHVAQHVEGAEPVFDRLDRRVLDVNGNTVGHWEITGDDEDDEYDHSAAKEDLRNETLED